MIRSNIRQVVKGLSRANVRQLSIMRSSPLSKTFQFKGVARTLWLTRSYAVSTDGEDISNKIDNISANEYNNISNLYLETLADELEMLSEDFPEVDCELSQGVMTLTIPSNGTYVINKQPPNKQIWLSSPISGPKRYDLIQGKWITLRDNSSLTELLKQEISHALGQDIDLPLEN